MNLRNPNTRRRSGTAAVELAVLAPFLFIMIMGIWEVGRMVQVQQLVSNAAREGGRQAAAGQQTSATIIQYVVNYLTMNGLTGVTTSMVTLTDLTSPGTDPTNATQLDQFQITVTVPYSTIRYSTIAQITPTTQVTATTIWYSMNDLPISVSGSIPTN